MQLFVSSRSSIQFGVPHRKKFPGTNMAWGNKQFAWQASCNSALNMNILWLAATYPVPSS